MADFEVDEELVRKLAQLLQETGLSEIEFEIENQRIRVSRAMVSAPGAATQTGVVTAGDIHGESKSGSDLPPAGAVTSPMVGTVYLKPEPSAPPFVTVGDAVNEGQTLLIIEAMKVMNSIPCPRSGKVKSILVEDGSPVEFGEPMIVIE